MPIATRRDLVDLSSENKTEELAKKLSKKLKPGNIVFFYGEMGVGKTTFIKYLINVFQKFNMFLFLLIPYKIFLANNRFLSFLILYHLYSLKI